MVPLPIIETPLTWIAMDIVGPLPRSWAGHHYLLVVCDYATRYPEAVTMKTIDVEKVAEELIQIFAWVGIPRDPHWSGCKISLHPVELRIQSNLSSSSYPVVGVIDMLLLCFFPSYTGHGTSFYLKTGLVHSSLGRKLDRLIHAIQYVRRQNILTFL